MSQDRAALAVRCKASAIGQTTPADKATSIQTRLSIHVSEVYMSYIFYVTELSTFAESFKVPHKRDALFSYNIYYACVGDALVYSVSMP